MDIFCTNCGEAEGVTPDDHECLRNLKQQFKGLLKSIRERADVPPGGAVNFSQARWSLSSLEVVQKELYEIHTKMIAVKDWHLAQVEMHNNRVNLAGRECREVGVWVNTSRAAIRELLTDV